MGRRNSNCKNRSSKEMSKGLVLAAGILPDRVAQAVTLYNVQNSVLFGEIDASLETCSSSSMPGNAFTNPAATRKKNITTNIFSALASDDNDSDGDGQNNRQQKSIFQFTPSILGSTQMIPTNNNGNSACNTSNISSSVFIDDSDL